MSPDRLAWKIAKIQAILDGPILGEDDLAKEDSFHPGAWDYDWPEGSTARYTTSGAIVPTQVLKDQLKKFRIRYIAQTTTELVYVGHGNIREDEIRNQRPHGGRDGWYHDRKARTQRGRSRHPRRRG